MNRLMENLLPRGEEYLVPAARQNPSNRRERESQRLLRTLHKFYYNAENHSNARTVTAMDSLVGRVAWGEAYY